MSAERFFDDLARTLAEPMPRRRAVRVIGASLAAIAVPGVSPRGGRAATAQPPGANCPRGHASCSRGPNLKGEIETKCCGYPRQLYWCGPDGFTCSDECGKVPAQLRKTGRTIVPTWSAERGPDGAPKDFACCIFPDFDPYQGQCLPSCPSTHGPGAHRCGRECCTRKQRCVGRRAGECRECPRGTVGCGLTCCDPSTGECLKWRRNLETGSVLEPFCARKCGAGKRRCVSEIGDIGECCPRSFPCCGAKCGCELGEECVRVEIERAPWSPQGFNKICLSKCTPPSRRCGDRCCTPDRIYRDRLRDGRTVCRCRQRP